MSFHVHQLGGCRPTPLAFYLKSLGILRLVAEQKDPDVRGAFRDGTWFLVTKLTRGELEHFFVNEYRPTPFVSPWNKGSGFFQTNDPGLGPIESSSAERFAPFREGIAAARVLLDELSLADARIRELKSRTKAVKGMSAKERREVRALKDDPGLKQQLSALERRFKSDKENLFPACRMSWRGQHLAWLDAALVLAADGKPAYPALLGTGGNDGRLDFTNNAMLHLASLFDLSSVDGAPRPGTAPLLRSALFGEGQRGLLKAAIGQFFPGNAGGANSSTGPDGESFVNPWDFVLMLEGTILFSSLATRRFTSGDVVQASAPFAVRAQASGYGSASASEESARGEQWMPLWDRPMSLPEVERLLSEGRAQIGTSGAQRPLDMLRAIRRLGVARGLTGFERYAYMERNGQSNLAVPLGRIEVRAEARAELVDDLETWLGRVRRAARKNEAPARLGAAERQLSDAVFAALNHEDEPGRWQAVLLAAANVETLQATGTGFEAGPIPKLRPDWIEAVDDGTPEFRLALALGLAAGGRAKDASPVDPLRRHWLPIDPQSARFLTQDRGLRRDAGVVAFHRDQSADCLAVVQRRLIEAAQHERRRLSIAAAPRAGAELGDLAALIGGSVELGRCVSLARAFMALDGRAWARSNARPQPASSQSMSGDNVRSASALDLLDPGWIAIRLSLLSSPLAGDLQVSSDPSIVRRLESGDATSAVRLALRRLAAAGLRATFRAATVSPERARLWGAALAFPISARSASRLRRHLFPISEFPATEEDIQHAS